MPKFKCYYLETVERHWERTIEAKDRDEAEEKFNNEIAWEPCDGEVGTLDSCLKIEEVTW